MRSRRWERSSIVWRCAFFQFDVNGFAVPRPQSSMEEKLISLERDQCLLFVVFNFDSTRLIRLILCCEGPRSHNLFQRAHNQLPSQPLVFGRRDALLKLGRHIERKWATDGFPPTGLQTPFLREASRVAFLPATQYR